MQGVQTPAVVEAEFRAKYLELANASAAAREIDIPESTGRDLARKAEADPEFVELRRELYARAMEEAELAAMAVIRVSRKRAEAKPPEPIVTDDGAFCPPDMGPAYGRVVIDGYRAVVAAKKFEAERDGVIQPEREVTIRIVPAEPPDDNDGGGEKA